MLRSRIWAERDTIFKGILDKLLIVFYIDIYQITHLPTDIFERQILNPEFTEMTADCSGFFKGDFYDPPFKKYLRLFDQ